MHACTRSSVFVPLHFSQFARDWLRRRRVAFSLRCRNLCAMQEKYELWIFRMSEKSAHRWNGGWIMSSGSSAASSSNRCCIDGSVRSKRIPHAMQFPHFFQRKRDAKEWVPRLLRLLRECCCYHEAIWIIFLLPLLQMHFMRVRPMHSRGNAVALMTSVSCGVMYA